MTLYRPLPDVADPLYADTQQLGFGDTLLALAADISYRRAYLAVARGLQRWNIDPATWIGVACQRAGRNLTTAEWAQYLPSGEPYRKTCPDNP